MTEQAHPTADAAVPLVLDVDGTFLRTDLLLECFWGGLGTAPIQTLQAVGRHFGDKATLKRALMDLGAPRMDLVPVNPDVAALAHDAVASGREVVLASASDVTMVRNLAVEYALSPNVLGSDGRTNLRGPAKAQALVDAYGEGGFDYAGNGPEDVSVWDKARRAIVVGRPPRG